VQLVTGRLAPAFSFSGIGLSCLSGLAHDCPQLIEQAIHDLDLRNRPLRMRYHRQSALDLSGQVSRQRHV
jgi:hypothetical protein